MSQQINLLNPALIKQKDLLNTNIIAMTLGLLLLVMVAYYGFAQRQLSLLTIQSSQVAEQLTLTQAQLKEAALLHTPHEINKALQDQIVQLEQKEKVQQQVLQTVNLSSATPDKGYAALMRAFAKQNLEGLWLTGFSIDSNANQLNISGRSTQADLVPDYIARLGHEPALKGKQFSALNMTQVNRPVENKAPSVAAILPSVTAAPANNSSPATATVAAKSTQKEIQYIEFNLRSTEENLAPITPAKNEQAVSGGQP